MYEPYFNLIRTNDNHSKKKFKTIGNYGKGNTAWKYCLLLITFQRNNTVVAVSCQKNNSYLLEINTEIFIALK